MQSHRLSRRAFLSTAGLAAVALSRAARAADDRPNIILIMADDMGYSDIGCYGGEIKTPNIDRLANGGLRFTQFYNAARCCPTRASLLTGLYPHQAGMGGMVGNRPPGPYQGYINGKCVTIAEVLRGHGYATLMSGKWHVGEARPNWPVDRGFDKYFGLISGGANYYDITKGKNASVKRGFAIDGEPYMPPKETFYMTDGISDNAAKFIETHGSGEKPFFLYVAYTAPHWPLHAREKDIAKYRGKYMGGWDALRKQRHARMVAMGVLDKDWTLSARDAEIRPWAEIENKKEMDEKMAVYAAQIDCMDQGIGRILARVKAAGKEDNTLVMFFADNGGCHEGGPEGFDFRKNGVPVGGVDSYMSYGRSWANASNTPFRMFKHWVHEGGMATPLVAHWPKVISQGGGITRQVGHVIDLMATCCDVAGAAYPKTFQGRAVTPLEGKSLLPIFEGKERPGHDALYWEHSGNKAVRRGRWKLVSKDGGRWELYDLEDDRTETKDRARDKPELAAGLEAMYDAWAARCGVRTS